MFPTYSHHVFSRFGPSIRYRPSLLSGSRSRRACTRVGYAKPSLYSCLAVERRTSLGIMIFPLSAQKVHSSDSVACTTAILRQRRYPRTRSRCHAVLRNHHSDASVDACAENITFSGRCTSLARALNNFGSIVLPSLVSSAAGEPLPMFSSKRISVSLPRLSLAGVHVLMNSASSPQLKL